MPDVMIMRGVPSMPSILRNTRPGQYPYETVHVVKLLREQGLTVEFEDARDEREYLSHYAFDVWLPVMMIASGVTVNLVTEAIKRLVWGEKDAPKQTILHVELTIEDANGGRRELKIDGPPDDVLDALNRLQREDGDGRQLPRV